MSKDTEHSHLELSPDVKLYNFSPDVSDYKGEISVWAHLPDATDGDDETPHVSLMVGKIWGHDDRFLELTPDQARQLARMLEACAVEVDGALDD